MEAKNIIHSYKAPGGTVKVEFEESGITWVTMDRPEKRNAMSPTLNDDMVKVFDDLEIDDRCKILVLTGAGEAFTAGMDLKEFFNDVFDEHADSAAMQARVRRSCEVWQWRMLRSYRKPTVAMVNGWCFGGAFTPVVTCDLAIAADEAIFGVSEINWGIIPAGVVTKALQSVMRHRDGLWYIMTGETFDGRKAAEMGIVNRSVPRAELEDETRKLCFTLLGKSPAVLYHAKLAYNHIAGMDWDLAQEWLRGMSSKAVLEDSEKVMFRAMNGFLDKEFRPGLEAFQR
ncbi:MAG: p-hydroxycinnamoyl CoA hydratase/lyase [Sphingomonas sp.]